MWNSDEHDLYYQGTTTAELPLTMEVSYQSMASVWIRMRSSARAAP